MNRLAPIVFGTLSTMNMMPEASSHVRSATDAGIVSGDYGGDMLIGFNRMSQTVSGYFQSYSGGGQFSCVFYLKGKMRDSEALVKTYFPDTPASVIDGALVRETREKFQLRLSREHGGCWNVQHFADKGQLSKFTLRAAYPWISVAVVKRDKVYFLTSPASARHGKAYVVKGDGVGVRAARRQWLRVDFISHGKLISGWIKKADVYRSSLED